MKTSQSQRLLEWLEAGKTITAIDAYSRLGILQLGTRLFDLKKKGHPIKSRKKVVSNRFGEIVTLREYYLPRKERSQ